MALGGVFPAAPANGHEAERSRAAFPFRAEILVEGIPQDARCRDTLVLGDDLQLALKVLFEEYRGPFHMTYASI